MLLQEERLLLNVLHKHFIRVLALDPKREMGWIAKIGQRKMHRIGGVLMTQNWKGYLVFGGRLKFLVGTPDSQSSIVLRTKTCQNF